MRGILHRWIRLTGLHSNQMTCLVVYPTGRKWQHGNLTEQSFIPLHSVQLGTEFWNSIKSQDRSILCLGKATGFPKAQWVRKKLEQKVLSEKVEVDVTEGTQTRRPCEASET